MSDETPRPDMPKPNIPKPNIPAPSIPKPNVTQQQSAPPISAVETGAMESPPQQDKDSVSDETPSTPAVPETILHKRILGGVLDSLISVGLYAIAVKILPGFLESAAWALQIGYMLTRDALPFLDGRSLGKMAVGLRAVTETGEPLTNKWEPSIIRNIPFAVPFIFPLVELIVLYTRENDPRQGRRLGDDIAKTKVIVDQS